MKQMSPALNSWGGGLRSFPLAGTPTHPPTHTHTHTHTRTFVQVRERACVCGDRSTLTDCPANNSGLVKATEIGYWRASDQ